ncbi:MAG: hypothetical protein H6724_13325 [Sandaracinus sp.]|nr:hypothetical protein [Sandaracinus sp.]
MSIVVAIVGGAVAGSEAAAVCAERGVRAVVFERGARPYGKIEDGLPRWHVKLRDKEYARVDANLDRSEVRFVPSTAVGVDVSFERLRASGFSAVVLANGAWRDRPLPVEGIDAFVGRGLLYQNPLVHWFNHHEEPGYAGPELELAEGALVVGGGLASIDVVKLLSLEAWTKALRARGLDADVVSLEHRGIPAFCEANGVDMASIPIRPPTLVYRRDAEDMPLADFPDGATEEQRAKTRVARRRILDRVLERYHVRFQPLRVPVGMEVVDGRLRGLVLRETRIEGGRVREVPGSDALVETPLVVSSIGSVPEPIEGVPCCGELYDFADPETGALRGLDRVFGLGNVLTGRGNIRDSRDNAKLVAERLLGSDREGGELDRVADEAHARGRKAAEQMLEGALSVATEADEAAIDALIAERWAATGYDGDYARWMQTHRAG